MPDKKSIYDNFQVLDDMIDDLKIIDSNKNEIDVNQSDEIVLLNNRVNTNIFSFDQLSIIKDLEKITKIRYLINVNITYWV